MSFNLIFGEFVLFDVHNMSTTLKMQNIFFIVKQTRNNNEKEKT